jgi:hypothetical protein
VGFLYLNFNFNKLNFNIFTTEGIAEKKYIWL